MSKEPLLLSRGEISVAPLLLNRSGPPNFRCRSPAVSKSTVLTRRDMPRTRAPRARRTRGAPVSNACRCPCACFVHSRLRLPSSRQPDIRLRVGRGRWRPVEFYSLRSKRGSHAPIIAGFIKGGGTGGVFERNLVICAHNRPAPANAVNVGLSFGGGTSPERRASRVEVHSFLIVRSIG